MNFFPNLKCRCFLLLGQDHFLPPPFDAVGLLLHYLGPSGVLLLRDKLWPAGLLLAEYRRPWPRDVAARQRKGSPRVRFSHYPCRAEERHVIAYAFLNSEL